MQFGLLNDISTNSIGVFLKDAIRMINDDFELSDPVSIKLEKDKLAWFPFMHSGRIFMNYYYGTCDIFTEKGQHL